MFLSAGCEGVLRVIWIVVISAVVVGRGEFTLYTDGLLYAELLRRFFMDECCIVIIDMSY